MKELVLFLLCGTAFAGRLLSSDDVHNLFVRFAKNDLSHPEVNILKNIVRVYFPVSEKYENGNDVARMSLECIICRSAFSALFELVKNGETDGALVGSVTVLCSILGIVSPRACDGLITSNLPILTYIIRTTPEATPNALCGLLTQNVGGNVCTYNDPRFEWEVELPERPDYIEDNEVETEDTKPLTIALVTDAHIDPYYEPYGVADCDEPTCCRKGQTPRTRFYKSYIPEADILRSVLEVNEDIMLDADVLASIEPEVRSAARNSAPAGYWGDYRDCDTPIWAYDDVIDRMASAHKDIDIVYYLGDSIDHHVWETTYEMINDVNKHVIDEMRRNFGENVPIIPVIGNHESQPTNQFAPSSVVGENINTTWLYEALADKWDDYLTEEAKATIKQHGGFSMLIRPKLRVISINNNIAYRNNWWLVYDPTDAKRHLEWLVEELYKAELSGERVHILAHIPPGVHDLTQTWTREYNRIVNRFSSTIAAEFNGHSHSDEFKIFYSTQDGRPINVAWGAGSATAYSNYNLNYKIATVDANTLQPSNIENYVYNLTEANLTPNRKPHWFQLYNLRNSFGLQDLSPTSMDRLVNSMVTDQKQLLDLYSAFYSKLSDTRWPYCNQYCKIDNLCKTVVTVLWERQKCDELRQLYFS